MIRKPSPGDYLPFYQTYLDMTGDEDILESLARQAPQTRALLDSIPEKEAGYRYAPGKWSIREVVGHMIDVERVMAYRALCIARGEQQPLPGFEQDDYVREAGFDTCRLGDLAAEFELVRKSNLAMFSRFSPNAFEKRGIVSGGGMTVAALVYIIAGHERRHLQTLENRYLSGLSGR